MIVKSLEELNIIVAESLGWIEVEFESYTANDIKALSAASSARNVPLSTIKHFCPPIILNETNRIDWFYTYGHCPDFALNFSHADFILRECDRYNLLVELIRSKEEITCIIRASDHSKWTAASFKPVSVGLELPRSMPLAIALAWLNFKGFEIQLELHSITNNLI